MEAVVAATKVTDEESTFESCLDELVQVSEDTVWNVVDMAMQQGSTVSSLFAVSVPWHKVL